MEPCGIPRTLLRDFYRRMDCTKLCCFSVTPSGNSDDDLVNKIAHLVLVDPIPILISNPSVAHNVLYREPWTTTTCSSNSSHWFPSYSAASSWQLWYFASRDADVARTLFRSFFWSEGGMWREEVVAFLMWRGKRSKTGELTTYQDDTKDDAIDGASLAPPSTDIASPTQATTNQPRRKMAVVLGGSDQIIPTEAIRRYLTNEDTWKTRWVGRVVDDSRSEVLNGTGEEEDRAEGNQLEVLYDPKLDHAKIFFWCSRITGKRNKSCSKQKLNVTDEPSPVPSTSRLPSPPAETPRCIPLHGTLQSIVRSVTTPSLSSSTSHP
jgi:hypothetical protein